MANVKKEFIGAVKSGDIRAISKILESNKVDINMKIDDWDTALTIAVKNNNRELIELLIQKGSDINRPPSMPPLFHAIEMGNIELVEYLISQKADIHQQFAFLSDKCNALGCALLKNQPEILKLLLDKGSDPSESAVEVKLPIILATENNQIEQVKILIDYGVNVDTVEHSLKNTALCVAAELGYVKIANYLIGKGADKSYANALRMTPLMIAVSKNQKQVVALLLEKGADPNRKTNKGETALSLANTKDKLAIFELLVKAGAKNQKNIFYIISFPITLIALGFYLMLNALPRVEYSGLAGLQLFFGMLALLTGIIILIVNLVKYGNFLRKIKKFKG